MRLYYLTDENNDAACDPGGSIVARDFADNPGAGIILSAPVTSDVYTPVMVFDRDVSGDSPIAGDFGYQLELAQTGGTFFSPLATARFQAIDAGCNILSQTVFPGGFGLTTFFLTRIFTGIALTWPAGAVRLRLQILARKNSPGSNFNLLVRVNNSHIITPYDPRTGGPVPLRRAVQAEQRPEFWAGAIVRPSSGSPVLPKPGDAQKRIAAGPRRSDAGLRPEWSPAGSTRRPPLLRPGGVEQDVPPRPRISRPGQPVGYDSPDLINGHSQRRPLLRPDGPAPVAGGLPPRRIILDRDAIAILLLLGQGRHTATRRIGGPRPPTGSPTERYRINSPTLVFTDRPFAGSGISIYATAGQRVEYRNLRVLAPGRRQRPRTGWIKAGTNHNLAADSVRKTARRHFLEAAAGTTVTPTLDLSQFPELAGGTVAFDVRVFRDDVENETANYGVLRADLDSGFLEVLEIRGVAELLQVEIRAAGVVRFRWRWIPDADSTPPDQFRWLRTAGPTFPPDFVTAANGAGLYETDSTALDDSAPYTFTLRAEAGSVTLDLLTGIVVQPDASGPPAVSQLITSTR